MTRESNNQDSMDIPIYVPIGEEGTYVSIHAQNVLLQAPDDGLPYSGAEVWLTFHEARQLAGWILENVPRQAD